MFWVLRSLPPILSNAGWSEAAAKTVSVVRAGPLEGVDGWPHAARSASAATAKRTLFTRQLHADIGRLDHRDRRHSRLEVELVNSLRRQQRNEPVRPRLDLDLGGDAILDHTRDDARKPVAGRLRDHHLRLLLPVWFGQPRQRGAVHEALAACAARRAQAPVVDHAAHRIGADPEHLRGLSQAIARHFWRNASRS